MVVLYAKPVYDQAEVAERIIRIETLSSARLRYQPRRLRRLFQRRCRMVSCGVGSTTPRFCAIRRF